MQSTLKKQLHSVEWKVHSVGCTLHCGSLVLATGHIFFIKNCIQNRGRRLPFFGEFFWNGTRSQMFTEVAGQHQVMRHVFLILTSYICLARATALMWSRNIHISQKPGFVFLFQDFFLLQSLFCLRRILYF